MQELLQLNHVNDYANDIGAPVYHPHVNVIHYDEMGPIRHTLNRFGVYGIFMQDNFPDNLSYGVGTYEIADGSLLAYAPGQIGGKPDNGHLEVYHGWVLMFDAEFMRGTEFERNLKHYRYFSYSSNEALILTHDERRTLDSIMEIIRNELSASDRNEFAEKIVKDYILLVADYCNKFYQGIIEDRYKYYCVNFEKKIAPIVWEKRMPQSGSRVQCRKIIDCNQLQPHCN